MRTTLRQLRYFVVIARECSLSRAATQLGVAQPALSQNMRALEEDMGAPLFQRHAKGMALTPEGERLVGEAQRLLGEVGELPARVTGRVAEPTGRVRLALADSLSGVLVAPLIAAVRERFPAVTLALTDGMSSDTHKQLESGQLDLALIPGADSLFGVEALPIFEEHFMLFGAAVAMQGMPRRLTLTQALTHPLAAPDRAHDLRQCIDRAAAGRGLTANICYELNSPPMLIGVVKAALARAILPPGPCLDALASGEIAGRPVAAHELHRVQSLVWPRNGATAPAVAAVRATLAELVPHALRGGVLHGRLLRPTKP